MRAIVLAGGKGTRLSPYTIVFPKPLMPINGLPILHIVISQLRDKGFDHITLAVGHMGDMIKTYFNDHKKFDIKIDYSQEEKPLGTIGALSLIKNLPENFLVMNSDVLTDLDFSKLFDFHLERKAVATIATYSKEVSIEYGIIESDQQNQITGYREKPKLEYQVSTGIYVFNSRILRYIRQGNYLDFPDLVLLLIAKGETVIRFPFSGYWKDIGCHADYEKAAEDFEKMKGILMPER
jgi:NDP-sugar pyrophosphorylase family protein